MAAQTMHSMTASCYCGNIQVTVCDSRAATSSSICHCSICRRTSGAPFLANVLMPQSNIKLESGDPYEDEYVPVDLATSDAVTKTTTSERQRPLPVTIFKS